MIIFFKKTCTIIKKALSLCQVYNWLVKGLHSPRLEAFFLFSLSQERFTCRVFNKASFVFKYFYIFLYLEGFFEI